jgi:hypothetical protein
MKRVSLEVLAAYVEGEVTPSETVEIEAALAESARARRDFAELRAIRDTLARPLPELESIDLAPRIELAIAQLAAGAPAVTAPRRRRWPAALGLVAALAAAAAIVLVPRLRPRAPETSGLEDGLRVKAAAPATPEARRWAGVQAFRVSAGATAVALGERLRAGDGLMFSYANLGPRPFAYLMVFAIDARGAIRWYYPAYERAGANPASLPLRGGVARVLLPDVIRHDLAPGPLEVRALFTRQPLTVTEVEAWLAAHGGVAATPPWPGAYQQTIESDVEAAGPAR